MSLSSGLVRSAAVAVAVFAVVGPVVRAADVPAPVIVSAAPVGVGDPGCATCATCAHGAPAGTCSTCKHHVLLKKNKVPYQVNLCPGACFGYFQTQWRKWDEACPYPYIGQGVSDAPRPASPVLNMPRPGSGELNQPRPLPGTEPKVTPKGDPKTGGSLPQIPPIPGGSKFAP